MNATNSKLNFTNIPSSGFLLLPNRLAYQDILKLENTLKDRELIYLIEQDSFDNLEPHTQQFLNSGNCSFHKISDEYHTLEKIKHLTSALIKEKKIIIFLSSEANINRGSLFHLLSSSLKTLLKLELPILPLYVNRAKEVSLSIDEEKLQNSQLAFGEIIPTGNLSIAAWQEQIYRLSEELFSNREILNLSLPFALLAGLKKAGNTRHLHDGADDTKLTFDKLLAAAITLAKEIRSITKNSRVGIILPPGKAGMIANLAVLFSGKVPVNLNFTASTKAIESAMNQANLDLFLSGSAFIKKVPSFPWPHESQMLLLEKSLPKLKKKIIRWAIVAKITPTKLLAKLIGISKYGGDDEAVLLFTSGSSGDPKGVPLTHSNIIANVTQFGNKIQISQEASVLGCLPLFHSFGSTVTLWYPIIQGQNLVTFTSPLDTKRLASLIETHKVELLLSTPTFLRGFMRRVKSEQLASVTTCVTGAEKLPASIAQAFKEKFNITPLEGYGLTEASPATNINIPDQQLNLRGVTISANRDRSVGQFVHGIAVKITDVDTDKPISIDQTGIVWLKGANIFKGYLDNPQKTNEVIVDGWFKTGDVGKVDSDGFLFIEGRISRFSKIAGEMVPHEGVEEAITKALELNQEDERKFAIVSVADAQKGEALAMLSTIHSEHLDQECLSLKYVLMDAGVPSLWCPKKIIAVDSIPVLASGKLDIKACESFVK